MPRHVRALCWFRRDLRDHDHAAFARALEESEQVHCVFVLDRAILDALEDRADRRVEFILLALDELDAALRRKGGGLIVIHGRAIDEIPALARSLGVDALVRTLAAAAHARMLEGDAGAATWLSELIWRDFFFMILDRHPRVVDHAFRATFDDIRWPGERASFVAWCEGRTGYPLVDAAMRHFNATGMMHNRMRMVTASFLVKDLHIDWRDGERWFAAHLNDYDLSANNGNWQWAASTGCDAQPWFRIFNPVTQSERFDPEGTYIRRHVPELARVEARRIHAPWTMSADEQAKAGVVIGRDYPRPIVEHDVARKVTLALYDLASRRAS